MAIRSNAATFITRLLIAVSFFFPVGFAVFAQSSSPVTHALYLIGDAGEPFITESTLGNVLREHIGKSAAPVTVLYLGDNVYPAGLPDAGASYRAAAEKILMTQADWIRDTGAKGILIPGNHDWDHWGRRGLDYILNQQQWVDSLKRSNLMFIPQNGCPGPAEVPIGDDAVLVIIDTQWFLHQWNKPAEEGPCDAKTTAEALTLLDDIFRRNYNKRVIVAGHHPLITYGNHGGVFSFKDHLFPLTDANPNLYIPLPVVGSLYPVYRKLFGHIQDTQHPVYKEFSQPIKELLKEYPGSIYVAGHEHALEYIVKDSTHFIVSGAGVKTSHVKKKKYAKFADDVVGFGQLLLHQDGQVSLRFFQVDAGHPQGEEIYSAVLPPSPRQQRAVTEDKPDFSGKVVRVKASNQYEAGPWRKRILGENYRKEWAQEIEVPVLDLGRERGGLKILQQGGGQQTLSLRLEDSTGHEYVIRSVEKYPEKAVPEMLRKTFAQDLVQDQISASHPYAALIIPAMAEAVGIYHTNPKLVYVPDDPRLGEYRKLFANMLALFEERPAGDWSDASFFGHSKKIVNTTKVLEKLAADNDNTVDQEFILKSRLFDLVIGDWDRHDDQWRWATFPGKKGDMYRPVPRDRDQAFFVNEGIFPKVFSRRWALPKFEGFDEEIDWPPGLSFNARYFDRTFLTELTAEHWIKTAHQVQESLTDDVIERAVHQWPEEISGLRGNRIIRELKQRRDKLDQYALSLYEFLSREVDVVGSDKQEQFVVHRSTDGDTHVQVFKITKDNEIGKKLYDRVFKSNETKEIRLYGLKGDDEFRISGASRDAIRVRVIGGDGKDHLQDSSDVRRPGKQTVFYDQPDASNGVATGREVNVETSADPAVNAYDRKAFLYNRFAPLVFGNFNPDDGLFVGGGFLHFAQGFRKLPFKQRHLFLASIAPLTWSFNFRYQGKFTEVIGKWNVEVNADVKSPNYVNNFFGFGNESVYNDDIDDVPGISVDNAINYYRYRFEEIRLEPSLSRNLGKWGAIKIGPALQRIEMEDPEEGKDRFINDYAATLEYDIFNEYNTYAGGMLEFNVDRRNHPVFTQRGLFFTGTARSMGGLDKNSNAFSSYEGALSVYHSFRSNSRLVFALRAGAGLNTGTYEFYQAQVLDGRTELRGFRKTRFYGDRKFYSNIEVRMKLLSFRSYLFPASMGITGFHDLGRVWYKDENGIDPSAADGTSSVWHKGWGGGLWFTPFNLTVLSAEMAHSDEGNLFYVRLGFLF